MVEEKFTRIFKPKYYPFWELEQESRPKTAPTLATEGQRERFQEVGPKRPKQTPSGTGFVSNNTIQGCNCSRIGSSTQVLYRTCVDLSRVQLPFIQQYSMPSIETMTEISTPVAFLHFPNTGTQSGYLYQMRLQTIGLLFLTFRDGRTGLPITGTLFVNNKLWCP